MRLALKEKLLGLGAALLLIALPLQILMPGLSEAWLVLLTLALVWSWRLARRVMARVATRALRLGDSRRARRLYWFLGVTGLERDARRACRISLAACAAAEGQYDLALRRLASQRDELGGALEAISLNLQAYCLGRTETRLEEALAMSQKALRLRPHVHGFRHTRGMVLLAMGRIEESARDLEATWQDDDRNDLLEAERCFDMGRLWSARGHADYASDYFERALRASPESRWAQAARPLLGHRTRSDSLEELLRA